MPTMNGDQNGIVPVPLNATAHIVLRSSAGASRPNMGAKNANTPTCKTADIRWVPTSTPLSRFVGSKCINIVRAFITSGRLSAVSRSNTMVERNAGKIDAFAIPVKRAGHSLNDQAKVTAPTTKTPQTTCAYHDKRGIAPRT